MKEKISDLLRRRLNELDLKKSEFARLTGLSRSYIGNIINETAPTQSGQYNLPPPTVQKFAKVLQIPETEILEAMNYIQKESPIPADIQIIGFDGLDDSDIKEIVRFIEFKKSQKT